MQILHATRAWVYLEFMVEHASEEAAVLDELRFLNFPEVFTALKLDYDLRIVIVFHTRNVSDIQCRYDYRDDILETLIGSEGFLLSEIVSRHRY